MGSGVLVAAAPRCFVCGYSREREGQHSIQRRAAQPNHQLAGSSSSRTPARSTRQRTPDKTNNNMGKAKPTKHTGVLAALQHKHTSTARGLAHHNCRRGPPQLLLLFHSALMPAAAEIKAKAHAATTNMGGGKAGLQDRKGGAVGHAKYMCPICKTAAPSLTNMQVHRYPKQSLAGPAWPCPCEVAHTAGYGKHAACALPSLVLLDTGQACANTTPTAATLCVMCLCSFIGSQSMQSCHLTQLPVKTCTQRQVRAQDECS